MSTNFPTGLDNTTNLPPISSTDGMDTAGKEHDVQHSTLNAAMIAVQTKVGINASADTSSLDYKVSALRPQAQFDRQNKMSGVGPDIYGYQATSTSSNQKIYLQSTKSTGKYYIEVNYVSSSGSEAVSMGFDSASLAISGVDFGTVTGSFGMQVWGSGSINRTILANGSSIYTNGGYSSAVGQLGRFAIDFDAGKLWMSYFGNSGAWLGGGDPSTGTSPTCTFTPNTAMRFGAFMTYSGITLAVIPFLNPNYTGVPAGFGAWTMY